ncbi:hypothetical protein CF319_g5485 [Tilletia indica]|nr:hypothetical protein CF319_g5485 [Tilletia indica]
MSASEPETFVFAASFSELLDIVINCQRLLLQEGDVLAKTHLQHIRFLPTLSTRLRQGPLRSYHTRQREQDPLHLVNGLGMTTADIVNYIGIIAKSGTQWPDLHGGSLLRCISITA